MEWIMARDQYGDCEHGLNVKHPRADLLRRLGCTKANKQYSKRKEETDLHTGYIVGNRWFTFYRVTTWEGA